MSAREIREMNADHLWSLTIPGAFTDTKLTPKTVMPALRPATPRA